MAEHFFRSSRRHPGFRAMPNLSFQRPEHRVDPPVLSSPVKRPIRRFRPSDEFWICGPCDGFTGYGQAISVFAAGLIERGIDVRINQTHRRILEDWRRQGLDPEPALPPIQIRSRVAELDLTSPHHLFFHPPSSAEAFLTVGAAVFTMWESTRLKPEWVAAINSKARVCITPAQWNASNFSASGINVPIRVVPLGIDESVFSVRPWSGPDKIVFGAAGRLSHGGTRKGIHDVVCAFQKAFPKDRMDVELQVKIWHDCPIHEATDPRIKYIRHFLQPEELATWYEGLTVFVSASRAEGWGLHQLQAMAIGRPLICPRYSGVADFFDDSCGFPVDFSLTPSEGIYSNLGVWAKYDEEHLVSQIRYAADNLGDVYNRGIAASRRAAQFTWTSSIDKLHTVLKEFSLL